MQEDVRFYIAELSCVIKVNKVSEENFRKL